MLKKSIAIGIILLFLFCNISFTTLSDENSGNLSGKTLYVGGSGPDNYTKIQDAINDSSDGDTVFVYDGLYNENLKINKSISLIGQDKYKTIIFGVVTGDVIEVTGDFVTIQGFKIENSIGVKNSGVRLYSDNNLVSDNLIGRNQVSIRGFYTNNNTIKNNWIYYCTYSGIEIGHSRNNTIFDNTIFRCTGSGIHFDNSTECLIYGNKINNTRGGIKFFRSSYNKIIDNEYIYGIFLATSSYNIISRNYFHTGGHGIHIISYSYNNVVTGNEIYSCGTGFYIYAAENRIHHNNLLDNKLSAEGSGSNYWDNDYPYGGNYWSDFDEPSEGAWDNNTDGIIDSPYVFYYETCKDNYPLKYPCIYTNLPPNIPQIEGNKTGIIRQEYEYDFTVDDSDNDTIFLYINWGDESNIESVGPLTSGEKVSLKHTWNEKKNFTISATAIDELNETSFTANFIVEVGGKGRSKSLNLFYELLNWLWYRFPIIEQLFRIWEEFVQ